MADGDAQLNRFVVDVLKADDAGAAVTGVTDAFQAGRALERLQPDLFLFDPMMDGFDAFTICRWLKKADNTRQMRLVGMTNAFSAGNVERLLESGADAFLQKPFTNEALLSASGLPDARRAVAPSGAR